MKTPDELLRDIEGSVEANRLSRIKHEITGGPARAYRSFTGYVYFIQSVAPVESKPIKIGRTNRVLKRFRALTHASPFGLRLIGLVATEHPPIIEQQLHDRFAAQRLNGEWFEPCEEMLEYAAASRQLPAYQHMIAEWPELSPVAAADVENYFK